MTRPEYVVIVLGLLLGYWIVSKFLSRKSVPKVGPSEKQDAEPKPDDSSTNFANDSWHAVLGLQRTSTIEEIRRAYKVQMSQYHPDKVAALGAELKALAERKSKDINVAYRRAMQERGVSEQLW
jgi:DnaJ like chaperone protein